MKNPLKALMGQSGSAQSAFAGAVPPSMDVLLSTVRKVEGDKNSFGIPIFDCREFATSLLADSAEEIVPETAVLTPEQLDVLPEGVVSMRCGLTYPLGQAPPEGLLFLARTMQDKWHIHHHDGRLIFSRSWTGDPLFVAEFEVSRPVVTVKQIHAYPGAFDGGPALVVGIVDFLIKSHLFRVSVPHPLPAELTAIPSLVATWSFNHFGRWGHFATWADVTRLQLMSQSDGLVLRCIQ